MSDDQAEADKNFENFWTGVLLSLEAAEDRIGASRGLIQGLLEEPGFIFMIGVYGVIEPIMNDLLCDQILTIRTKHRPFALAQQGAKEFVRKQAYSAKSGLLRDMGLIGKEEYSFVEAVGSIRNRYSHNIRNLPRPIVEIALEAAGGNTSKIAALAGTPQNSATFANLLNDERLKYVIMAQLADFLSNALHTLRPPLPPVGTLFGLGGLGGLPSDWLRKDADASHATGGWTSDPALQQPLRGLLGINWAELNEQSNGSADSPPQPSD